MRLNPDCVRDILLAVEDITDFNTEFSFPEENSSKFLEGYSQDEIYYHLRQCKLSGFFHDPQFYMGGSFTATDLSPHGHVFINDIRSDNNWNKTKSIASKVGSHSLDALKDISAQVIASVINSQLNQ